MIAGSLSSITMLRFAGIWLLVGFLPAVSYGQDDSHTLNWPHIRGPRYDAISLEKSLADTWPKSGPPLLWSRELGQGYSGFVADVKQVYTQFQNKTGMFIVALDADNGSEIWSQRVDWPWQPAGAYPGPYATPTWYRNRIYYTTPLGIAGCLNAEDGQPIWAVDLRQKYAGKGTEFGYAATPFVEEGRVILPVGAPGASVVALDPDSGETLWAAGNDAASYCPIYPVTFRNRRLIVAFLQNCIVGLDPKSGRQLWRHQLSSHYDEHSAWPLYREPDLMFAFPFKAGSQSFRLEGNRDDFQSKPGWLSKEMSNDVCSSVLHEGSVYGFDLQQLQSSAHRTSRGEFKCLDFATGHLRWKTEEVGQATVLIADDKLILLNDTGTLILAKANSDKYEELSRIRVLEGGLCWTPPALSNGRLFLRNHSRAVCLFIGNQAGLPANSAVGSVPTLKDTRFDWSRLLTREPEFPHDAPTIGMVSAWFGWSLLGTFGIALIFAAIAASIRRKLFGSAFLASAFLLGLSGTSLYSIVADQFILTWPISLYLVFRITVGVIGWAESQAVKKPARWLSRGMVCLLIASGYGYYRLCLVTGYVMAWGFLIGFLPAAPLAMIASRISDRRKRILMDLLAFAVYFFASGMFPEWKQGNSDREIH